MPVRTTMAALISRVRLLINDPFSASQQFSDQEIQDILDASRVDLSYLPLAAAPTYSGGTIRYLDYYADLKDWEDDIAIFQTLTTQVTPSVSEPIVGHWEFATSTFPPLTLTGKTYDVYRTAADLLERLAARWTLEFDFTSDGQSFRRGQATDALQKLARTYRAQQRPGTISLKRSDLAVGSDRLTLKAAAVDYIVSGDP